VARSIPIAFWFRMAAPREPDQDQALGHRGWPPARAARAARPQSLVFTPIAPDKPPSKLGAKGPLRQARRRWRVLQRLELADPLRVIAMRHSITEGSLPTALQGNGGVDPFMDARRQTEASQAPPPGSGSRTGAGHRVSPAGVILTLPRHILEHLRWESGDGCIGQSERQGACSCPPHCLRASRGQGLVLMLGVDHKGISAGSSPFGYSPRFKPSGRVVGRSLEAVASNISPIRASISGLQFLGETALSPIFAKATFENLLALGSPSPRR